MYLEIPSLLGMVSFLVNAESELNSNVCCLLFVIWLFFRAFLAHSYLLILNSL